MPTFFTETTRSIRSVRSSTRTTCSSSTELFPSSPCYMQNSKENMQMPITSCAPTRCAADVGASLQPEVSLWSRWCCAGAAGSECLASTQSQPGCPARCLSHPVGEELEKYTYGLIVISDYCPRCGGHNVARWCLSVVLLNTKGYTCMLLFRGAKWKLSFNCFCCDRVVTLNMWLRLNLMY